MFGMKWLKAWIPLLACAALLGGCNSSSEDSSQPTPPPADTAPYDTALYLRGSFNNWDTSAALVYQGQRRYEVSSYLAADSYSFKISDADWSADWTFSGDSSNATEVKLDSPQPLVHASGMGNDMRLVVSQAGYYHFTFTVPENTADPHSLTVTLDAPPYDSNLYVRGSFNSWGTTDQLIYQGHRTYTAVLNLSVGTHEFKLGDATWSEPFAFTGSTSGLTAVTLDKAIELKSYTGMGNNLQLAITEAGLYTFSFVVPDDTTQGHPLTVTQGGDNSDVIPDRPLLDLSLSGNTPASVTLAGRGGEIPEPDVLFNTMAITDTQPMNYVFGDNLDGYYDGQTGVFSGGGKYHLKSGWIMGTFASLVDGNINDRTAAVRSLIQPYGSQTIYSNGTLDDLSLLAGHRAVALHLHSDKAAKLGIVPQLNLKLKGSTVERSDQGVVVYAVAESLRSDDTPAFVAIAADQPVSFKEATLADMPQLGSLVQLDGANVKPMLTTQNAVTDVTVYVAFGFNADEAATAAGTLVADNARLLHQQTVYDRLTRSFLWTSDTDYNRALLWAKLAGYQLVTTEFGDGIWAGLSWFKDNWGRDTFISLPGITLVNGDFTEAKAIINSFAKLQNTDTASTDYGRVPNRVTSLDNIIYNTTDGTPWMVREIGEYLRYTGDTAYAASIYPTVKTYLDGALANYVDADGLLTHDDADTWMDARIDGDLPWSARGSRAVDIQALWINSLQVAAELADMTGATADATRWRTLQNQARTSFIAKFWNADANIMADRVRSDGSADTKVRPNQLMAISVPLDGDLIDDAIGARVTHNAVSELLFPWGITSLSQHHEYFHPYHDGRSEYAKDAAYHNGTIWGWNAGFTVTSLTRFGENDLAYQLSKNLGDQILNLGYRGTMSEVLDAFPDKNGKVTTGGGTYTQAWSVAEYNRNGYQDYVGFRPNLIAGTLNLNPSVPDSWTQFAAVLPFEQDATLDVDFSRAGQVDTYTLHATGLDATLDLVMELTANDSSKIGVTHSISNDSNLVIVQDRSNNSVTVNGVAATVTPVRANYRATLGSLQFAEPDQSISFPMLQSKNALRTIIEAGEYR